MSDQLNATNLQVINERLECLEREVRFQKQRATRLKRLLAAMVAVTLLGSGVFASRAAFAQSMCSYPGLPAAMKAMCADTPALADEINANNKQLVDWLQQKVGTVGSADVRINSGSSTPLFVSGNLGGGDLNNGGVEFKHSNGTQGVGIGFNTVYATGSNADQALQLKAKGNEVVRSLSDFSVNGSVNVSGNINAASFNNNGNISFGGLTATSLSTGGNLTASGNSWGSGPSDQGGFSAGGTCPATAGQDCPNGQYMCGIKYTNVCGNNWFNANWVIKCCAL